ncbi:MAG TPA: hypothetical protein VNO50_15380 [Pyrinomonadaceae bacterium]|nr:hypothetical protein [Pyrinomonadaceae bacterium]
MIDILDELRRLVAMLDEHGIDYALCGGMAMGVHGLARTTIDIDLLITSDSLSKVYSLAGSLGCNVRGKEMSFANGTVESSRVSKIDPEDAELLSLDLLLVTPATRPAWESRLTAEWEGGKLSVVSAGGLVDLKRLRGSDQDLVDIKALTDEGGDETG